MSGARNLRLNLAVAMGVILAAWCGALDADAAARLDYRGQVLSPREVQSLAGRALRAPRDSVEVSALLGTVVAMLEERGYLDARATAQVEAAPGGERLVVNVLEGRPYRLDGVEIVTPGPEDSAAFAAGLDLAPGDVASPPRVGEQVALALRAVVNDGHAYARLGVTSWEADSQRVTLTLSGALGPQVVIRRVRIEGLQVTRPALALRAMGSLEGLPYDPRAADEARLRLEQLGLFQSVALEGLEGEADWRHGQLVYRVEEMRYNRFDGVVGVQGEAGTVGSARLDLGNVLGTGRQVGLFWQSRGPGLADLAARYVEPLVLGLPVDLRLGVEQEVQDTIYVRTRWGGRLSYAFTGRERLEGGYEEERVVQGAGEVEEASMQQTVFGLERSALDRPFAPRRGTRARLTAAQIFKRERLRPAGERTSTASAVGLRGEWHVPLRRHAGATLELMSAGRFSSQRILSLWERYAMGGAASLRGYDEEAFRVDRYLLSRLEWRWFLGDRGQRAFLFWDHAWMGTRVGTEAAGGRMDVVHRDGYGAGLRLEAAGGLIGIDYGLAAGRPPLEGKIHLQLVSTF